MLIPRTTRLIPTKATRDKAFDVVTRNPPEKFETYPDWFYFIHVDPVQRVIHLIGMLVGLWIYWQCARVALAGEWKLLAVLLLVGTFFFYGFGVISHFIYDRGAAKSDPAYWWTTLFTVVYINLATMFCVYDRTLRDFIERYPWVVEEWDLVEMDHAELLAHLLGRRSSS